MKSVSIFVAAGSLLAAVATAQTPSYTITDLGPAGTPFSLASYVNDNGFVAGVSTLPGGAQHATLWYQGIEGDIHTTGFGGPNSFAGVVNVFGEAVVQAETSAKDPNNENFCGYGDGLQCLAYLWQNGVITQLPTLGGVNASFGGINSRGEASGYAETATRDPKCPSGIAANGIGPLMFDYKPVIWGPGKGEIHPLALLPGDTVGIAMWINDNGQAVGFSATCGNSLIPPVAGGAHAVLWDNGTVTDLGNLGGTSNAAVLGVANNALAINNSGQIAGVSALPGNTTGHPFLWTWETGMKDLGVVAGDLGGAGLAINNRGEVVGVSYGAGGPMGMNAKAAIWRNGTAADLNTLMSADAPLYLLNASSINDRGQITGLGISSMGDLHGFLASPSYLSEPGAAPNVTNAVVTPLTLTTSQPSVVLDGGGSTSGSGALQYLFTVAPGGKQAALLQTPSNPQATVDFESGPGLYLVQLTVTDGSGNTSKSPVANLNYQP
jgi:probable HAF family extracellular repeat protein